MTTTNLDKTPVTISVPASEYEDCDDCLAAAESDVGTELGLAGWTLNARWADEDTDRSAILLTVPRWALAHACHAYEEVAS